MKLTNKQIGAIAVVIVLCIAAFIVIWSVSPPSEKTAEKPMLYFNADTDLPDSALYLKTQTKEIYEPDTDRTYKIEMPPVHEIVMDETYFINFTIASLENSPVTYTYVVEPEVLGLTEQVTLQPGESKSVCLTFIPRESEKWGLDSTTTGKWEHVIDLTRDSWVSEWSGFEIVESEEVGNRFGGILHANISIDELRIKPLVTEHVTEREGDFEKTRTIDLINLSVNGDKLYLNAESEELSYTSDEQLFRIKLFKPVDSQEIQISPESYIAEEEQEIHFWYRIK